MSRHRSAPRLRHLPVIVPLLILMATTFGLTVPVEAFSPVRALRPAHAADRLIVGFKPTATKQQRRRAVSGVARATRGAISRVARDTTLVELRAGQSLGSAIVRLESKPGVAYAEPDYRVRPAAMADDPRYLGGDLWGMYGSATTPHANPFGSAAGAAWAAGYVGSSGIYVGIVDEGVQVGHPELTGNAWRNQWETTDGADNDGNGLVDDMVGWDFAHDDATVYDGTVDAHGTHVAGIIGARGGNGIGVAGVDWRVTMIPAKFMGPGGGYISDAVRALDYITDLKTRQGLDVVATNNSWSGGGYSQALNDAIDRGGDAGILFVAAAGNDGRDIDAKPAYPAAYRCVTRADGSPRGWDCVVAVANLQRDGDRASDSNWGATSVDMGAPGSGIISTHPAGDGGYAELSGTSMATAHVSGAVALCASADPGLPARRLRDLLLSTAAATSSLAGRTVSGARLDVAALLVACASAPPPSSVPTVLVDDLDSAFFRDGSGWLEGANGYADHHYWVPAQEDVRTLQGAWRPVLGRAGWYDIDVRIPASHATTRQATYQIRTSTGWVTRVRNQNKHLGSWVSLGRHYLTTTPIVRLVDKTAEEASLQRRLAFDAVRFVPDDDPEDATMRARR